MVLNELIQSVYDATKRPDLVAETKLAVKSATLKAHQTDFYPKDILETGIQFDGSAYVQQINMQANFPRYRAMSYFRRYDNSGSGEAKEFFELVSPFDLVDDYGVDKTNVVYSAGLILNIKSAVPMQYALVGFYQNPSISDTTFESWIAVDHPFYIVYEAARLVFKQIGYDEQSAAMDKLAAEHLALIKLSGVQTGGY